MIEIDKQIIINKVWQYSKYHGNMLYNCEIINEDFNSFASLILLFNLLESIFKNILNNFVKLIKGAYDKKIINQIEYQFLNDNKIGIRKVRNFLAHANISKYNFKFTNDKNNILYPFSENENCYIFYNIVSPIIFKIILKVVQISFMGEEEIFIDNDIKQLKYDIVELSPREVLKFKGFRDDEIDNLIEIDEAAQYRLSENSGDVNVLSSIFKKLLLNEN